MKSVLTSFAFVLLILSKKATACDCLFIPTFCETITYSNNGEIWDYLNIYHVKVASKTPDGMNVEIFKTFFGANQNGGSIFITSGDGANCGAFTSGFEVGQEMIISTQKSGDNWSLSICGVSFLPIENGMVKGAVAAGVTEIPLEEFQTISNCGNLQPTPTYEPTTPGLISITPTLTNGDVFVKALAKLPAALDLQVFDVTGRMVFQTSLKNNGTVMEETIRTEGWAPGMYFFNVIMAGKQQVFKVVKAG